MKKVSALGKARLDFIGTRHAPQWVAWSNFARQVRRGMRGFHSRRGRLRDSGDSLNRAARVPSSKPCCII
jgi:hypothetical protein